MLLLHLKLLLLLWLLLLLRLLLLLPLLLLTHLKLCLWHLLKVLWHLKVLPLTTLTHERRIHIVSLHHVISLKIAHVLWRPGHRAHVEWRLKARRSHHPHGTRG